MYEEATDKHVQEGAALSSAPAPDPLDAVMAVAGPRGEGGATDPEPGRDGGEEAVEVTVRLERDGVLGRGGDEAENPYGEFEWPDGYSADPKAMSRFLPLARKLGLSRESAQSLARLHAELDCERERAQTEFIAKNNSDWLREIQSHPEFGGANLERTGQGVASLMRRYGSPLLANQMRQMNVQNWPEMFYFLARVSQAMSEDCSPSGGGSGMATRSTAQLLFPDLK